MSLFSVVSFQVCIGSIIPLLSLPASALMNMFNQITFMIKVGKNDLSAEESPNCFFYLRVVTVECVSQKYSAVSCSACAQLSDPIFSLIYPVIDILLTFIDITSLAPKPPPLFLLILKGVWTQTFIMDTHI